MAAALLPLLMGGCLATRQDVDLLRSEAQANREAQDRQIQELIRRTEAMLDSLSGQNVRMRADVANRLVQIDRQLVQIQALNGQSQQQLRALQEQIDQRAEAARRAAADTVTTASGDAPRPSSADDARDATPTSAGEAYDAAMAAFRRGSLSTARLGFQEFLRVAPQDRRAAGVQLLIGETYARDPESAIAEYQKVVDNYPRSTQAPTALLRIGKLELGRGNRTEARARFNEIVRAYPRSPEATEARTELGRLPAR